jgi:hypothetical protein
MPDNSNQIRRHIDATSKELELFVLKLEKILKGKARKLLKDLYSGNDTIASNARNAIATIAKLDQVLVDAEVGSQLDELRQIYGKELAMIRQVYFADAALVAAGAAKFYSGIDADVVETLIKFDVDTMTTMLTRYVDDVRGILTRAVITGKVPTFEDAHDGAFSAPQFQTEVQTMFSSFSQSVIGKKAKDLGFELFQYLGPLDKVTRAFCEDTLTDKDHPGAIYTMDEINEMDNGQLEDVYVTRGGYNCRHQWRPVSLKTARELGYLG